jgi:hypothetical protein
MDNNIKLCRQNGTSKKNAHYWSKRTGKAVKQPRGLTFTEEETCPKHLSNPRSKEEQS